MVPSTMLWLSTAAVLLLVVRPGSPKTVSTEVLVDSRVPKDCSSPGWMQAPYDIATVLGSYVYFNCRSSIQHSQVAWLYNGKQDILSTPQAFRVLIWNGNSSLRYGPVQYNDSGVSIGCEVTTEFGKLPSTMGTITVNMKPSYSPKVTQVGIIGQPYDFDFNYTSSMPPSSYRWFKNGRPFQGIGERVTVDHTGIVFSRLLQQDAGQYKVVARNSAGEIHARSTLQVIYWFSGSHVQTGSSGRPTLSSKLAATIAMNQQKNNSAVRRGNSGVFHISRPDSTSYAMQVIQTLLHRASKEAEAQGRARLLSERIITSVLRLVGMHNNASFISEQVLEKINNFTNCTAVRKMFNCLSRDVLRYRTIDGTCNNFFYPLNGAALTSFARLFPASYEDGISLPVGHSQADPFSPPWPSARLVSWKTIKNLNPPNMGSITHMFMQWGQFLDHDLDVAPLFSDIECGCNYTENCQPIPVREDDSVFGVNSTYGRDCLPFVRSVPACKCGSVQESLPRNQINQITSYLDASNMYGSTKEHAKSLRLFKGGLLKQGGRLESFKGNLPFQEDKPKMGVVPFFVAGDERANEQTGLTVMHTLWLREHNRIARRLSTINPCWSDETLYQETRKIVGAQMQVITYNEFLPLLFGTYYETFLPPYQGYNPFVDATIPNSFATSAYRFGHSLIRSQLDRLDKNFRRLDIGPLPLERAFFNPLSYFESGGTDPITRGLTIAQSNRVDEFLNRVLTSKLFSESPNTLGSDLASLNIQRGRDHGIPAYRTWQRFCEQLFPGINATFRHIETAKILKELYGEEGFRNGIDLWVGGLAENALPSAMVGPTFACIIGLTFTRVRDGDRFWYESPYVFTPAQRFEIKQHTSLAKVICTNGDDIPEIQRTVFRSGERVACSGIRGVNLWRWWDRRCYSHYYYGMSNGFHNYYY